MAIHKDDENECKQSSYNGFLVDTPLEVLKTLFTLVNVVCVTFVKFGLACEKFAFEI
mgnify:FL=1